MRGQSKFRKLMNEIHLWLGLISGLFIFIVCLSGCFITFNESIRTALAQKIILEKRDSSLSLEELILKIKPQKKGKISSFIIADSEIPYIVNIKKNREDRRGTNYKVDQYSGKLYEAEKTWYDDFYMFNFRMHRWLTMDDSIGRPIVGTATIVFILLTLSGLILWLPKKIRRSWKIWKPGFTIKTTANWKRINHDLHNVLGFYTFIIILIMGLTGLCWSFDWYKDGASEVLGTKIFDRGADKKIKSDTISLLPKLSIDQIYTKSKDHLTYEGVTKINLPSKANETYILTKYPIHSVAKNNTDKMFFDQNGTMLKEELFINKSFGQKIASLIKPLHTGEIYGVWSEILYFISSLIGASLPITGTIIWFKKLRKKKRKLKIK